MHGHAAPGLVGVGAAAIFGNGRHVGQSRDTNRRRHRERPQARLERICGRAMPRITMAKSIWPPMTAAIDSAAPS